MAGLGETLLGGLEQTPLGVTLTDTLVASRNLPRPAETQSPESRSKELMALLTVRLDRENICAIGRLQSLQEVRSLYLQQNRIEKIENLSCFPHLRFLSLAGNRIRKVENLRPLQHLHFLDLSQNQIERLDADELPRSLRLLDLTGNECTHQDGYRELVLGALPRLLQLDAQPVPGCPGPAPDEEEEEEEGSSSSSEDEEDESLCEPSGPFTAGKDFFMDLHRELARRSQRRQREALDEHETRLEELEERWGLLLPPPPLGSADAETCLAPSPGAEGAAFTTAPGPGRPQPCPQAKPGTQQSPVPGAGSQHACPQPERVPSGSQGWIKALQGETRATAQPREAKK
ncbi:leucine-rich repeat-containing protein 46 [Apteryx rowi]|uniref:leucine-rich repeat-containing protein 46 n=1 Tax=Apteryx rowi TaxID=308060 RepID=UPI000E1C4C89|nr:leucine-rich repeat-containing protein 46 [Apteryx rowi]